MHNPVDTSETLVQRRPASRFHAGRSVRSLRTGLAPLEFVLVIPLLLFVMALMINYGTVAGWRVRTLGMSRHAAWQSRHPRSMSRSPRPAYWPASANVGSGGAADAPSLDFPAVDLPVVRGPTVGDFGVRSERLDPSRGFRRGSASLDRDFPLLPSMGPYHVRSSDELVENLWDFHRTGQAHNFERRTISLYLLPTAPAVFSQNYVQAALAILYMPLRQSLLPLDRDDEFIGYAMRFQWGGGAPDFHPRVRRFCSLDWSVASSNVEDTLDHIYGRKANPGGGGRIPSLPERMASSFIGLYERVIQELQAQMNMTPPPAPISAIQAEISDLQQKIDILDAFRAGLQNHGR